MAYQDRFYTTGAVTVQNGSAVVTGEGTGWETALIDGGVIFVGGGSYPIYSVENETSLTLAYPFTGVSGADLPYAVDRQRAAATSNIQMNDRLAQIIREISIGNIEELNALTLLPDKSLSTDGQGKLQLINLGQLGRALLALAFGTSGQIVQADGTIIDKSTMPVSNPMQAALNDKLSMSAGGAVSSLRVNGALYTYANQTGAHQYSEQVSCFLGNNQAVRFFAEYNPGNYYGGLIQLSFPGGSREWYFKNDGSFTAYGTIIGAAKNFEIDHPADPDNYDLRHCATESPEMLVEYRGTAQLVNGNATIDVEQYFGVMPGTFDALWADAWVTVLQNQDSFDRLKPSRVSGSVFTIICENQNSNDLVTWELKARRNDAYVRWEGCTSTDADGKLIVQFEKASVDV
ncbi:hypothetical protein ACWF50_15595 [Brucella pseudogrignonensis]